jgi:hypothetical protein
MCIALVISLALIFAVLIFPTFARFVGAVVLAFLFSLVWRVSCTRATSLCFASATSSAANGCRQARNCLSVPHGVETRKAYPEEMSNGSECHIEAPWLRRFVVAPADLSKPPRLKRVMLIQRAELRIAELKQPTPVPSTGSCPSGWSYSTSGVCTPLSGTKCKAFPSAGSCPVGFSYSPTARLCVETGCR